MICKNCGTMFNEKESIFCPVCGQHFMENNHTYNQQAMPVQATQYQQYAGKYYPGLSKKDFFGIQWLKKYNISIMVISIIMYVFEVLMIFALIAALSVTARRANMYGRYYSGYDDYIVIIGIAIIIYFILLLLSVVTHVSKNRLSSGFVMGFYMLSIIGNMIQGQFGAVMLGLVIFGLEVSLFILTIIYQAKWNSYKNTGIIPVR